MEPMTELNKFRLCDVITELIEAGGGEQMLGDYAETVVCNQYHEKIDREFNDEVHSQSGDKFCGSLEVRNGEVFAVVELMPAEDDDELELAHTDGKHWNQPASRVVRVAQINNAVRRRGID